MLRKVLVLVAACVIVVFCLSGCKKRSEEPKSEQGDTEVLKKMTEYEAEAEEQITKKDMVEELEKIEKEMQAEADSEQ